MDDTTMMMAACVMCVVCFLAIVAAYYLWSRGRKSRAKKKTSASSSGTAISSGASGETVISYYGQNAADDNGFGASGVDLFKMKGLQFNGKPVYPVAVHHDDAPKFLYKVLHITGKGIKPIQGVVLDFCNRKDSSCTNKNKFGKNFLIDIHKLGFTAAGQNDGLTTGTYQVIGEIRPSHLPKSSWPSKITSGGDSILCSCIGTCEDKQQKWTLLKDCK